MKPIQSALAPRFEIPDTWVGAGHCPACGSTRLRVVHLSDYPDYLICEACEFSFEVGSQGNVIRLKNIPDQLGFMERELHDQWIAPGDLHHLIINRKILLDKVNNPQAAGPLSDEEVWERMLSLHRLGNQPRMIELTLLQTGATKEQAAVAMKRLLAWREQEVKRQTRKFFLVGGIASFLILALLGTWLVVNGRITSQLEAGMANPAQQVDQPILPLQLIEALPDGMKPGFLGSPDTRVDATGPSLSACPVTTQQAATLFGGKPTSWSYDSKLYAWQMMNAYGSAITIRVPAGMHAGYINNQTMQFSTVIGPATISNVNFAAIMCD